MSESHEASLEALSRLIDQEFEAVRKSLREERRELVERQMQEIQKGYQGHVDRARQDHKSRMERLELKRREGMSPDLLRVWEQHLNDELRDTLDFLKTITDHTIAKMRKLAR